MSDFFCTFAQICANIKISMNNVSPQDKKLLMFICRCSDQWNEVNPELVLAEAKRLVNQMHQFEKPSMKAWDYIEEAQATLQTQEQREYWRKTPGYQVAAVMYILLTLSKPNDDWRDEYLARNLANAVFARPNFNCTQEQADNVVEAIRSLSEPQLFTIPPMKIKEPELITPEDDCAPDIGEFEPFLIEHTEPSQFAKLIIAEDVCHILNILHKRIDHRKGKDIGVVLAAATYKYHVLSRTPTEKEFREEFSDIQECSWRSISQWLTKPGKPENLALDIQELILDF